MATKRLHTDGTELELNLTLNPNAVIYFEVMAVEQNSDRGYSYERVMD